MKFILSFLLAAFALLPLQAQDVVKSDFSVKGAGHNVVGTVGQPANPKGKLKVAIASHGFNGVGRHLMDYIDRLCKSGYVVYVPDYAGSQQSRTDNNTMHMSTIDEKNDLIAIAREALSRKDVDKKSLVLIGESQGGYISTLAAAELGKKVSALILVYPALCIPDNWRERYPTADAIPEVTDFWGTKLSRRFFEEIIPVDIYAKVKAVKAPVQIIHGDQDKVVPVSYSEHAQKEFSHARLHVIKGAGHGFNPAQRNEMFEVVNQFLKL